MGTRQHADLSHDLAHGLGVTAVDPQASVEDRVAHHICLERLEHALGHLGAVALLDQRRHRGLLGRADLVLADLLHPLLIRVREADAGKGVDALRQRRQLRRRLWQAPRLLGGMLGQFDDGLDHRLEMRVAERHGTEHYGFVQLLRFGLHHQHTLGRAGQHQVELAGSKLLGRGVQDVFAIRITHAGGGDGAEERDTGQRQCRRTADHGHHVGIVLHVMAQHGGHNLDLVAEALRE